MWVENPKTPKHHTNKTAHTTNMVNRPPLKSIRSVIRHARITQIMDNPKNH